MSTYTKRLILAALPATAALLASGPALGTHAATKAKTATKKTVVQKVTKRKVPTRKYKGPVAEMRWGPVQAVVTVKGKKITHVQIKVQPDTERSQFIDDQAVPLLQQEVLQMQSANINLISGATMTSEAFVESLQVALQKAGIK